MKYQRTSWPSICRLLLSIGISNVFLADGRGRRGRSRPRGRSRGRSGSEEEEVPLVVDFKYATKLTAENFTKLVEHIANGTAAEKKKKKKEQADGRSRELEHKQDYYPFVVFYSSTEKESRLALPEFEKTAELYTKAKEEGCVRDRKMEDPFKDAFNRPGGHMHGMPRESMTTFTLFDGCKLEGLTTPLKFFVMQCDESPENQKKCKKHAGITFPTLKLYRDKRAMPFTGPKWGLTMVEWAVHMSRPSMLKIEKESDLQTFKEHATLFMIKAEFVTMGGPFLDTWIGLAFDFLQDLSFSVVPTNSEVWNLMPKDQAVWAVGKNIAALPYEGGLDERSLRAWVSFNRWQIVVDMTPDVTEKLKQSNRSVVTYAYKFGRGAKRNDEELNKFKDKAAKLRKDGNYIFASIDLSNRENSELISNTFPVVSVPGTFVFRGPTVLSSETVYWEDPELKPSSLSLQVLEDLVYNDWARHDTSKKSRAKGWAKTVYRFGSGSVIGFILVILLPLALSVVCCLCIWDVATSQEEPSDAAGPQPGMFTREQDMPEGTPVTSPEVFRRLQGDGDDMPLHSRMNKSRGGSFTRFRKR